MKCNESRFTASVYLDGRLGGDQKAEYQHHLAECGDCRSYLGQLKSVSRMVAHLPSVEVPRELRSYVMSEVRQRSAGRTLSHRAFQAIFRVNPHLVSYSVGLVASLILFGLTLAGFRPISIIPPTMAAEVLQPVVGSDLEYHSYNDLPPDARVNSNEHSYELPRVGDDSSLVTFGAIAYPSRGDDGTSALIEVGSDGKAKVVEVLEKPKDPDVIPTLKWSLSKRPFQPAIVSGKPVQTRIVLICQKVDVSG
ncbi:MAG TPA: zf-HC2 domain-containing protein [Blastocatellia bacterium]|nr:zf-HC2 domain-containing protein [Blastocatellia bacterium]